MGLTSSLYHTLFKAHASGFQLATCRGQEGIFFLNDVFPKASGMPTAGDETLDREDQGSELTLSSLSLRCLASWFWLTCNLCNISPYVGLGRNFRLAVTGGGGREMTFCCSMWVRVTCQDYLAISHLNHFPAIARA